MKVYVDDMIVKSKMTNSYLVDLVKIIQVSKVQHVSQSNQACL